MCCLRPLGWGSFAPSTSAVPRTLASASTEARMASPVNGCLGMPLVKRQQPISSHEADHVGSERSAKAAGFRANGAWTCRGSGNTVTPVR